MEPNFPATGFPVTRKEGIGRYGVPPKALSLAEFCSNQSIRVNPDYDHHWPSAHVEPHTILHRILPPAAAVAAATTDVEETTDYMSVMSTTSSRSGCCRSTATSNYNFRTQTHTAVFDVSIHDLSYKVHDGKKKFGGGTSKRVLLNKVSARASHSEIFAIIGRSGSSKSTLLDALAGRIDPRSLEGHILVNGKHTTDGLKFISGYVMQDDALFPMLSTREILMFSAKLRLPNTVSKEQKRERVNALIEELGLSSCCDTRVGNEKIRGISGGERRRLSIGVDIIHDPPILLLDEPTSGLDSTSALQVMETLYQLAVAKKHTVILTVHQPSYRMLTNIHNTLLLAKGNVVYQGDVSGMVDHFTSLKGNPMPEHVNVVEYALDTIAEFEGRSEGLQKLIKHGRDRTSARPEVLMENGQEAEQSILRSKSGGSKHATSFLSEFMVLSQRNFYNMFRTHTLFLTRVGVTVLTSLVMVSLFCNSPVSQKGIREREVFMIFTVAILVFTSTESLPIFLLERQIFIREKSRGAYRTSSYVLAHSLVVQPFFVFLAALCTVLSYFAVGLAGKISAVFFFFFIIFLVLSMASAFVMMISALAPNFTVGLGLVGGLSAYMFLFSGFFVNKSTIPIYWLWLHYLSLFKYSYESLMANEFESLPGLVWYDGVDSAKVLSGLIGGRVHQWVNVGVMIAFIIGYRIIFYLALRFGTKSVRT